jgi:hypothetical protein
MIEQRPCAHCSTPLTRPTQRKYCSTACAAAAVSPLGIAARRTRSVRSVACSCGLTFETTEPTQRYCSDPCRRRFNAWKTGGFRFMPRNVDRVWRD